MSLFVSLVNNTQQRTGQKQNKPGACVADAKSINEDSIMIYGNHTLLGPRSDGTGVVKSKFRSHNLEFPSIQRGGG